MEVAAGDPVDAKTSLTRAGGDTTPPARPAEAKKSDSSTNATASSSKAAKPAQHAQAKSTAEKKSAQHVAKSPGDSAATADEKAFRQALRGCAERQDQAQRDSCLDEAIEKFQRNT
jgi:hypothetical protein